MAKEELNVIIKAYNKTGTAFKGVNRGLSNLRRSALNLKFALASVSAALAVKTLVKASVDMQKMTLGLKGATGGAASGAKEFAYLNEVVDRLKLDLKSSGEAFTLLTAAARGTSLEGKQTREAFEAIAISSKVLGRSAADTEGVLYALQQMISKGKVTSEELRRQMGDRLPGAFKMAAKAMNMTESQLDSAMRKGEVYSTDFIPKFTKVLMDAYADQLPAALKTTASKMTELSTAMFRMKATLAESGVVEVIMRASDAFIEFAKSKHVGEVIAEFGSEIKKNKEGIKDFLDITLTALLDVAEAAGAVSNAFLGIINLPGEYSSAHNARKAGLVDESLKSENREDLRAAAKVWDDLTEAQKKNYLVRWKLKELNRELEQIQKSRTTGNRTKDQVYQINELNKEIEANNKILIQLNKEAEELKAKKALEADIASLKKAAARSASSQNAATDSASLAKEISALSHAGAISKEQQRSAAWEAEQVARKKKEAEEAAAKQKKDAEDLKIKNDALLAIDKKRNDFAIRRAHSLEAEKKWFMEQKEASHINTLAEDAKAGLTEYAKYVQDIHSGIEDTVSNAFSSMEDAIVEFTKTGKLNFSDFANSVISDMMRMVVQQNITAPLAGMVNTWLGGLGSSSMTVSGSGGIANTWSPIGRSANGNAFGPNGLIKAFASGGIVNSPILFPDAAGGANVMGEAGAEGILPLKRVGGKLGVNAEGMGGVSINQNFDLRNADESSIPKLTAAARQIKQETLAAVRQSLSRGGDLYTLTRG